MCSAGAEQAPDTPTPEARSWQFPLRHKLYNGRDKVMGIPSRSEPDAGPGPDMGLGTGRRADQRRPVQAGIPCSSHEAPTGSRLRSQRSAERDRDVAHGGHAAATPTSDGRPVHDESAIGKEHEVGNSGVATVHVDTHSGRSIRGVEWDREPWPVRAAVVSAGGRRLARRLRVDLRRRARAP